MKRTLAWIAILFIAAAFILLIYFTATGAPANIIMATIFAMIIVPVIIYAFLMSLKFFNKDDESIEQK